MVEMVLVVVEVGVFVVIEVEDVVVEEVEVEVEEFIGCLMMWILRGCKVVC